MGIEYATAWVMVASVALYVLLGGADFGGGVWDLLARGPTARRQRDLVERAIGPIWEANHIWLIVVVVVMFVCFPKAYAAISTALHVPLTIMLLGIVARGSAFALRSYNQTGDAGDRRLGRVFSIASVATPVLLGVTLGTLLTGDLRWNDDGVYVSGFVAPWLTSSFAWLVGLLTLSTFAFLAAVYLAVEAEDDDVREAFRVRALVSGVLVGVFAWSVRITSISEAPEFAESLRSDAWSWPLVIVASLVALGALWCLWKRRYVPARTLAAVQTLLLVAGFGAALFPWMVPHHLTLEQSSATREMHALVLGALAVGALILIPSLIYLLRVFKGPKAFALLR